MAATDHIHKYSGQCLWKPTVICNATANNNNPLLVIEKSYQALSVKQRQKIQQDMYGEEEPIEETVEFVDQKLEELQKELNKLNPNLTRAYMEAVKQQEHEQLKATSFSTTTQTTAEEEEEEDIDNKHNNKDYKEDNTDIKKMSRDSSSNHNHHHQQHYCYIASRKFLLMFLRSESFVARLAALRLAQYFREKLNLFGREKLPRRIRLSDLNEQDLSALHSGRMVIPGITDGFGRLVIWYYRHRGEDGEKCMNMKRALFYLINSWLEDNEESQKRGVVFICWSFRSSGRNKPESLAKVNDKKPILTLLQRDMPLRYAAIHICYCELKEHVIINFFLALLPTHLRRRFVLHCDPPEVCPFNILPYGVDIDLLPLMHDGNFHEDDIIRYVEELHQKELIRMEEEAEWL